VAFFFFCLETIVFDDEASSWTSRCSFYLSYNKSVFFLVEAVSPFYLMMTLLPFLLSSFSPLLPFSSRGRQRRDVIVLFSSSARGRCVWIFFFSVAKHRLAELFLSGLVDSSFLLATELGGDLFPGGVVDFFFKGFTRAVILFKFYWRASHPRHGWTFARREALPSLLFVLFGGRFSPLEPFHANRFTLFFLSFRYGP